MQGTSIALRDIIRILRKNFRLIGGVIIASAGLALILSLIIPPTYEAETTLRIKQPKGLANSLLADLPLGSPTNTKQQMSTYAEILRSRTVVQEVIDKTQSEKEQTPTYDDMLKRIRTIPVKDTEILEVKVQAGTPEEAQLVANTLVDSFLSRMTVLVRTEQATVRGFIGDRLDEAKESLEKAENTLQAYKQDQQIIDSDNESKALVDKLSAIDKLSADNRVALAAAQAHLAGTTRQLGNEAPGFIADNPVIQQYKTKLADLEVQRVMLVQNYTEENPKVQALDSAIRETRELLNTEIANVVGENAPSANTVHLGILASKLQAEVDVDVYSAQKRTIDTIIAEDEQIVHSIPAKQQGLVKALRDVNVAQELYIMLAKRYEEARISEVMEPTDVQVIDVAIAPEKPIKPRKVLNTVIGAMMGLLMGAGIAFFKEYMYKTVRTEEDVQQYLGLPVLGRIPDFDHQTGAKQMSIWERIRTVMRKNSRQGKEG